MFQNKNIRWELNFRQFSHCVFRRNSTNVELNQPLSIGLNSFHLTATLLTSIILIVTIYMLSIIFAYLGNGRDRRKRLRWQHWLNKFFVKITIPLQALSKTATSRKAGVENITMARTGERRSLSFSLMSQLKLDSLENASVGGWSSRLCSLKQVVR